MNTQVTFNPIVTAARIKSERERLKLTQVQSAERLPISLRGYRNLESEANPTLRTLVSLVELGMRLDVIAPELLGAGKA